MDESPHWWQGRFSESSCDRLLGGGPHTPAGWPSSACYSRIPGVRSIATYSLAISFSRRSIRSWRHFEISEWLSALAAI
jgi:hypothetical protein